MMALPLFLLAAALAATASAAPATTATPAAPPAPAAAPATLPALTGPWPRVVQFRQVENTRRYASYEEWAARASQSLGFIAQAIPDQLSDHVEGDLDLNAAWFDRFKREHPDRLVLIHINGLSQVNAYRLMDAEPCHWLYFEGARVANALPAESGESELQVSRADLFVLDTGFSKDRPDDLGLCALGPDGRPDWNRAEYARLVSIDADRGVIRVQRGLYGSTPRAFAAGQTYVAALVNWGPWGGEGYLEWQYNFSTLAPRDPRGRRGLEMYLDYFKKFFGPGGPLARADGIAFDVLYLNPQLTPRNARGRLPDFDADGRGDDPLADRSYAAGLDEFFRALRPAVGRDLILTSDAQDLTNQRSFFVLNGAESENWPGNQDPDTRDWSTGLNRSVFWDQFAREPKFNYLNHKITAPTLARGTAREKKVPFRVLPFNIHRLRFTSALFTHSVLTQNVDVASDFGFWDEFVAGREQRPGWLGQPRGPMVRLAAQTAPDLLAGAGAPPAPALPERLRPVHASFHRADGALQVRSPGGGGDLRFVLTGLSVPGPDLTVFLTARGAPLPGFPDNYARLLVATPGEQGLPIPRGESPRGWENSPRAASFLHGQSFTAVFTFRRLPPGPVEIEFTCEGSAPLWIESITAHAAPDAIVRPFDGGLVLANPSLHPVTFDLAALFPGERFRRLEGTPRQDPATNNGEPVGPRLQLPAEDGLFLRRLP